MLTKAEEARIANDKARINDLVATAVIASYDTTGQLDKAQLLANLNKIPGVDGLPKLVEEMEFDKDHPLKFTVDGYDVTVEWTGKVTVGDQGEGGSTPPTPVTYASESESYVGYYADLDGDPDTVEGIIYADLAVGHESSMWNGDDWSVYQYSKATSGLKSTQ